ncbi:stage II sporulation protein M [Acidianus infernus]|uniref:stage II sporulation protein M n=1 Tax=Acidianus infernus TaxID=12915 RepID=UPI00359407F7
MRRQTLVFFILFIIELIIFIGTSALPVNQPQLASQFQSERSSIVSLPYPLEALSIFTHNYEIALAEFIPALGVGIMGFSIGSTGYVLSAVSNEQGVPGWIPAIFLLTLPHSWLELPSYAFAATAGLFLLIDRNWKRFLYMIGFVGLELFFAASVEAGEIVLENVNVIYYYLFWIPAALLLYVLYEVYEYIMDITEKPKVQY